MRAVGSPPRAWGLPPCIIRAYFGIRFTPTCVGTTYRKFRNARDEAVHPHVRGDYIAIAPQSSDKSGSPPRAWGLRNGPRMSRWRIRFTPTCVGTTNTTSTIGWRRSVHPHVRGDYNNRAIPPITSTGSPPRAWGLQFLKFSSFFCRRFTPTCVGTTTAKLCHPTGITVHPHVRGDYWKGAWQTIKNTGSPPRAWGLLEIQQLHEQE